jgi:hypothetical protein
MQQPRLVHPVVEDAPRLARDRFMFVAQDDRNRNSPSAVPRSDLDADLSGTIA